jgi:hypothetical protein
MVINNGEFAYTGSDGGICGYFLYDLNIIRKPSARTGASMQKNVAFDGFRKSTGRLKDASPIAAALYNRLPKAQKQYSLYRLLTGETIKMIKEQMDKTLISEILYKQHIEPRLLYPENYQRTEINTGPKRRSVPNKSRIRQSGIEPVYVGRVKGFNRLKIWEIRKLENCIDAPTTSPPTDQPAQ